MITVSRRVGVLASCVLALGWSVPFPGGSGAHASDPPTSIRASPPNSTTYKRISSAFALTISPTRLIVKQSDIGKVSTVMAVNRGRSPLTVTVQKQNFSSGLNGALDFAANAPYAAANWLTVTPTSFVLAPGASRTVTARVTVPLHPDEGDHQVAVVFFVPSGRTSGNIRINRGIATPMYITVPGPTSDTALLGDLSAPGFVTGGPVTITATIRDTGTVHRDFRDRTRLVIHASGAPTAFPDFTVLRGSTRDISTTWDPPLMCVCHATVSFTNTHGDVQSASVRVIVFPVYPAVGVVVALVVLGLVIRWRRLRTPATVGGRAGNRPTEGDDE